MTGKFLCLGEKEEVAQFRTGAKKFVLLNLLDQSVPMLTNTLDYQLSEDEIATHSGKVAGKVLEIGFSELATAYGGRLRGKGKVLSIVNGK